MDQTSVVALVDDVFVVTLPDDDPDSPEAVEAYDVAVATQRISEAFGAQAIDYPMDDEEYDEEGYDATEDDPVDLAMRVATGDRMDLDDEEEDEDEEIVFTGSQGLQNQCVGRHLSLAGSVTDLCLFKLPPSFGHPSSDHPSQHQRPPPANP